MEHLELRHLVPEVGGYAATEVVGVDEHFLHGHARAQVGGDLAGEGVVSEVQRRRRRRPRLAGTSPWSALNPSSSARRNVRLPTAAESVPASPFISRSSPTTRGGLLPLVHATPSQLQKSVLPFHEASAPPPLVRSSALNASSAASSPPPALAVVLAMVRTMRPSIVQYSELLPRIDDIATPFLSFWLIGGGGEEQWVMRSC
ncbi:LOW QUALITY PROTEIN: hypothetical protein U9M48_023216 [Paspalum notatum var. saurae]|uniref:Uncharacterized protein n=1 Tax=Paspalum notatum var. saurae TaxID=547442 RepID=A0AAQ3TNK2_PASNO